MRVRWIVDACGRTVGDTEECPDSVAAIWAKAGLVSIVEDEPIRKTRFAMKED